MPDIKLWYAPGACSLAPHVLLREIRVPFNAVETSVARGANLTDEFARINPKKRVPVLALNGEVIAEVPAIATAIADLAPERHLVGRTALDRARIHEWMNWLSGNLHGQGNTISECFEFIEGRLSGAHATGDGFTAADPFLLVFYRWGNGIGIDMPKTCPSYTAFARRLVQRDSVAAALAAEGIDGQSLRDQVPRMDGGAHITSLTTENVS